MSALDIAYVLIAGVFLYAFIRDLIEDHRRRHPRQGRRYR